MKNNQIYIVTSSAPIPLHRCIQFLIREKYTHVSLSLDIGLTNIYSFRRRMIKENLDRFPPATECAIYELNISTEQYCALVDSLQRYMNDNKWFKVNHWLVIYSVFIALPLYRMGIYKYYSYHKRLFDRPQRYNCGSFTRRILEEAGIDLEFDYEPYWKMPVFTPHAFSTLADSILIYKGLLEDFHSPELIIKDTE